jgi:hypothetical protein
MSMTIEQLRSIMEEKCKQAAKYSTLITKDYEEVVDCLDTTIANIDTLKKQLALSLQMTETLLPFSNENEPEHITKTRERHIKLHNEVYGKDIK